MKNLKNNKMRPTQAQCKSSLAAVADALYAIGGKWKLRIIIALTDGTKRFNELQRLGFEKDGIILNPGGYTHTSVAIGDAIAAIKAPVVEVHISNVQAREDFRKLSHVSGKVAGSIIGLGLKGYELAVDYLLSLNNKS